MAFGKNACKRWQAIEIKKLWIFAGSVTEIFEGPLSENAVLV
jgi:hypothetical protein